MSFTINAVYTSPNDTNTFVIPVNAAAATENSTQTDQTNHVKAVREAVVELQDQVNKYLTERMEVEKNDAAKALEDNYGEEICQRNIIGIDMDNIDMEQLDALLANKTAMDYDLMQFLKSFDNEVEQPQGQLFTLLDDEFDVTDLPSHSAGEFDSTGLFDSPAGEFDPTGLFDSPADEFDPTGLFESPASEFDSTGFSDLLAGGSELANLSNSPAGPEPQPPQPTEPLPAVPKNTPTPSVLNLEDDLYASLNTYLQNTPRAAPIQRYQPISRPHNNGISKTKPQPRYHSVKPITLARSTSPPIIVDNYQAPARPPIHQSPSSTPTPCYVSRQSQKSQNSQQLQQAQKPQQSQKPQQCQKPQQSQKPQQCQKSQQSQQFHQARNDQKSQQAQRSYQAQQPISVAAQPTQSIQYPKKHDNPPPPTSSPIPAQSILTLSSPIKPPNLSVREWQDLIDIEDQLFMNEFMPPDLKATLLKDQARYRFKIKNGYFETPTYVAPSKPPVSMPLRTRPGSPLPRFEDCFSSDWMNRLAGLQAWKTLMPTQQKNLLQELCETYK
ncbi:hypothetical protein BZA77DRAFT_385037 [Pyronema omphalodes]|nr:hypothetical protein BZA77DRAFT_385037 [Pyronema omphalodes]